jgi:hypothetical protein
VRILVQSPKGKCLGSLPLSTIRPFPKWFPQIDETDGSPAESFFIGFEVDSLAIRNGAKLNLDATVRRRLS